MKNNNIIILVISVFVYTLGVTVFFVYNVNREKKMLYQNVDFRLKSSVHSIAEVIDNSKYESVLSGVKLDDERYLALVLFLTKIADNCDFKFIYTAKITNNKMYFTASSATKEELSDGLFVRWGEHYVDAPNYLYQLYRTGNPDFFEYSDKYGSYRSYGIIYEKNGVKNLIVADKAIDTIRDLVAESIVRAVLTGIFFISLVIPFIFFHILQSKREIQSLKRELYIDRLTGISNRNKLMLEIDRVKNCALFLINIDSFKEINNFFGFEAGDKMLKEIASKLIFLLMSDDYTLFKLQADEFAILYENDISTDGAETLAKYFVEAITETPFEYRDSDIYFNVTCGVAIKDQLSEIKGSTLINADIALKTAKKNGKKHMLFKETINAVKVFENNINCTRELKEAIKYNRVISYFQPIVNNKTGEVEKYESLIRIVDSNGKVISPIVFLDIAKMTHMYFILTRIMINNAFKQFEDLPYQFSINLSVDDILDEEMGIFIIDKITNNPETAKRLVFEILESEGIDNYGEVVEFIKKMKAMGVEIAIDDFGSGYSNFDHIVKLNVDYIKIDGSLIKNLDTDNNSRIITKQIVALASELGIKTVAEFVHSEQVLSIVKGMGCDYSQGYFVGEPSKSISWIKRTAG